jgi:hypothetical protein
MSTTAPKNREALKVSTSILTAWRDARDALIALFAQALFALLILLAMRSARTWIIRPPTDWPEARSYYAVYNVVQAFLMTPYAIAVHRFIILGEKTTGYRIAPADPKFQRFFCWWLALWVLYLAPAAISALLPMLETPFDLLLEVVLHIPVFVLAIRVIVVFPAVAVGAPGADWRRAIANTGGHAWRIFFIILGAMLPLVIAIFIFAFVAATALTIAKSILADIPPILISTFLVTSSLLAEVVLLFVYTLVAVIASRLYQRLGPLEVCLGSRLDPADGVPDQGRPSGR